MTTVTTIKDLIDYADQKFELRYSLDPKKLKANLYVFDVLAQEGRDVVPQLVDRMKHEFDLLLAMGAKIIVLKDPPTLVTDGNRERISAAFNAHDEKGNPLRTGYEYIEGDEITPERNTIAPPKPKPAPVAIAGYDLVEDKEDAILLCALLVHNTVKTLNDAFNEYTVPWDVNRDSIIAGVKRTLENPTETPEANHNAWAAYKFAEGWTFGATKDAGAKTHPCLVPYEQLGPHAKSKDAIFQAIVRTFFGL